MSARARRRTIVPEVIQTSATDCGPASLKSILEGMGLSLSYRGLREACQTDVDGTSIDTLEELAQQLGLEAEQIMLPMDYVFLPEVRALPAIIVTLTPGGRNHFVVLWNRVGPFAQVMDPATGRHWMTLRTLRNRLYTHTAPAPAGLWREWAGSDEAVATLRRRLKEVGSIDGAALIARALEDPLYRSIARLDAATRAAEALVSTGAVRRGPPAGHVLRSMLEHDESGEVTIPGSYWSVRPNPDAEGEDDALLIRGAVLIRFRGWRADAPAAAAPKMATDVAKALQAPQVSPHRALLRFLAADPLSIPLFVGAGLAVASGGRILQTLMLRALLDLGRDLGTVKQRAAGMLVLAAVALVVLLLQIPLSLGMLGIGRRLEVRLRKEYFEQLPNIEDRFFQSRLASDMAARCHAIQSMRTLPTLIAQAVLITLEAVVTAVALVWIAPAEWKITAALVAVTLVVPVFAQLLFSEPDMRIQTHAGALSGFTLDALLGLTPIRIHGAERSLRRGQEALVVEWTRARFSLQALTVAFEGVLTVATYALVVALVSSYLHATNRSSMVLLVVFWALRFPTLGQRLLVLTRSFPSMMNRVRRLLEMMGHVDAGSASATASAPVHNAAPPTSAGPDAATIAARGVAISMDQVRIKGAGHTLLKKVSLDIRPGEHVAIVGPSGAGKSTLVGLLLGWLRPVSGEIRVDGQPLDQRAIERLRRVTAWVDPSIQLWNQSLLENLRYGNDASGGWSFDDALKGADLLDLLEALPEGLQTKLGEGGGLVSGGQGQRVRLGRAMLRADIRLAILDEPFRGLDRDRRARLLKGARQLWANVTLLCVTHDVVQTQEFDRVLVVEGGRVVENGPPAELLTQESSRYAELVRADRENHELLWRDKTWRHWWLADGRLEEKLAK